MATARVTVTITARDRASQAFIHAMLSAPPRSACPVPLSADPFERHAVAWYDPAKRRDRISRFNTDDGLAAFLTGHGLTLAESTEGDPS